MTAKKEQAEEVLSLEEAETDTGMSRATIYNYMKKLAIKPRKFALDRRTYLAVTDVERIKVYKKDPRKAGAISKVKGHYERQSS